MHPSLFGKGCLYRFQMHIQAGIYCMISLYHRVQGQLKLYCKNNWCEIAVLEGALLRWIRVHVVHGSCIHSPFFNTTVKYARESFFSPPLKLLLTSTCDFYWHL